MRYFFIFTFLFSTIAFSQATFYQGYFIDNQNIKTICFIRYNNPVVTPTVFDYKLSKDGAVNQLNLQNTKFINIENIVKYVNANVAIDNHSSNIQILERTKEIETSIKNHFLKVVVEGKYTLYNYEERGLNRFFYSKDNSPIELLKYKIYDDYDHPGEISENNTYKRQLWASVVCEFAKNEEINNLEYKSADLEKYFMKINECVSGNKQEISYQKYKGYFNVKASLYSNFLQLKYATDEIQFGNKTNYSLTGQLEYVFAFNDFRWSVNIEPIYFTYSNQTQFNNINSFSNYNNAVVTTEIRFFALPFGISYSFYKKGRQQAYINVAQSLLNKVSNNYYTFDNKPNINFDLLVNDTSFSAGLGYNYCGLEMQFNFYPNFQKSSSYAFNFSRSALIVRYTLFNNNKNK